MNNPPLCLRNFEVKLPQPDGTFLLLPTSSHRYRILDRCVDLGLSLLETDEGQASLRAVARAVIAGLKGEGAKDDKKKKKKGKDDGKSKGKEAENSRLIYRYGEENLHFWVNHFLQRLRDNFPPLILLDVMDGEAAVSKYDWTFSQGKDVAHYHGKAAGLLYVSGVLIDNMVNARQQESQEAYNIFVFQMGISIAHEIVHFLTGFLVGTPKPNTPPDVTVPGYEEAADTGEAGRYWESKLLGGVMECYASKKDPLGLRQAGTPYVFSDAGRSARGFVVSRTYIRETVERRFSFPMRTEGEKVKRSTIRRTFLETGELRNKLAERLDDRPTTPTTGPGADMRFRKYVPPVVAEGSSHRSYRKY